MNRSSSMVRHGCLRQQLSLGKSTRQASRNQALRILKLVSSKRTTTDQSDLRLIQGLLCNSPVSHGPDPSYVEHNPFDKTPVPAQSDGRNPERYAVVLSRVLSTCCAERDLRSGIQYHCLAMRTAFLTTNVYVGSSLVTLYSRCGEVDNAYKVFEEMTVRNVVLWTAIIAGFSRDSQVDTCLRLYSSMRSSSSDPNDFTFASLLSVCTDSGALGLGRGLHCQTIRMGFEKYICVSNSLISMYCKCGWVEHASLIFLNMSEQDIVSWNSMIAGYAHCGLASQSIGLFREMKMRNVKPDRITFLAVLSSCRHAGFVELGKKYLDSMVEYGLTPSIDHYSCVVDLLGRYGKLEEALDFIQKMPLEPNAVIWGSLLSSCRLHGNVWIGIEAAESRLLLEPECAATHVQLANLYASVGCWHEFARLRRLMKDKGIKTCPGYSWVEIGHEVHKFTAEDGSNDRVGQIIPILDCLMDHMRSHGYIFELHDSEDDGIL